jgi:homoserine kinase
MGSSSAALVAGLAAGLAIGGKDMSTAATKKLLLQMAAEEEGHADNVAPAIYGGFQIAFNAGGQWITQRVKIPEGLQCVLFIPDDEMPTSAARAALPEKLEYKDAIFNISRAAMLINCFASSQFEPLRYAMQDRLHQPYRTHMFPYDPFIETALAAGAHGAFLSGAGPTVLALTGGTGESKDTSSDTMCLFLAEAVSDAMMDKAKEMGKSATVHIASPTNRGVNSVGTASDGDVLWGNDLGRGWGGDINR